MLWKRKHTSSVRRGTLTAFVDDGSEIEGKSSFSGTALLNGRFRGEVLSSDTLIIGERAVINATVRAATLIVNGEVTGKVEATGRVELRASARVFGDVEAPVIVIDEGAFLQGHCRVTRADAAEAARDLAVVPLNR